MENSNCSSLALLLLTGTARHIAGLFLLKSALHLGIFTGVRAMRTIAFHSHNGSFFEMNSNNSFPNPYILLLFESWFRN